jgi:hypothetical protein
MATLSLSLISVAPFFDNFWKKNSIVPVYFSHNSGEIYRMEFSVKGKSEP